MNLVKQLPRPSLELVSIVVTLGLVAVGAQRAEAIGRKRRRPTSPALGDLTLRGAQVEIGTSRSHGAAVTRLAWNGKQLIDNADHGRQLQVAWNIHPWGEGLNPTEAGSRHDGAGRQSSTRILAASAAHPRLTTTVQPAYWLRPGERGHRLNPGAQGSLAQNTTVVSPHRLQKIIHVDYLGNPHLMRWDTQARLANAPPGTVNVEAPTAYLVREFSEFHTWDPRSGRLAPLTADQANRQGQFPQGGFGEQSLPVIASTPGGSHALGFYSPDRRVRYGRFNFTQHFGTAKLNAVWHLSNVSPAGFDLTTYVAVGTLADVAAAFSQARSGRASTPPPQPAAPGGSGSPSPPATLAGGTSPPASPGTRVPVGCFDGVRGSVAYGWALDPDDSTRPIMVHVYAGSPAGRGGVLLGAALANHARPDVNRATGFPGAHGFGFTIPPGHQGRPVYIYAIDSGGGANPRLPGSP